ncbi:MAG: SGNH/GDSL hydrolase family protein [Oscillospiraceae bacterium]|nr:SGNH/GDSL hydrolase family protein [Oscillospiraceae bacterium]
MKNLLAMLLSCSLLFSVFACSAFAETSLLGGWNTPDSPEITPELQEIFDQATEGLLGVNYTPVALVGTQVVSGMNYCFLCEAKVVVPDAVPYYANITIYKDLNGKATVTEIEKLETHSASEIAAYVEEPGSDEAGFLVIAAEDAVFTEGKGVSAENKKTPTAYDAEHRMITCLAKDGEVTYTIPEGVDGIFDLYLTISKIMAQFTSQPFSFSVNGGELFSVPIDCQVPADSPAVYNDDGEEYNTGTLMDDGRFLICSNVALKGGDTFTIVANYGAKAGNLKGMVFPAIGDLTLVPAGLPVTTGYDYTVKSLAETDPNDPLSGLNIIWVGSSVTYGAQAGGHYSMVDAIADNHPGTVCEKYAISATTLVNGDESSYVSRLKRIPKNRTPDLVVVQLSTNDATTGKPFGEISESKDPASFDDKTIAGAIETIISYVQDTFHCPVVFYTGTYCEKENYAEMVDLLLKIQEKWGIGVIDMFHNQDMTAVYGTELYNTYMYDEVHPYRIGYVEWWTPVIEQGLLDYMASLA